VAYYRKVFTWPKKQGQRVQITFDGVAGYSDVWLNGFWIGQSTSSYTPLSIDITELLRSDIPNVILVRSDSIEAEGWWMEGGGIYRHVWLETYGDLHITQHGVYITTSFVVAEQALVVAQVEVTNEGGDAETMYIKASIIDPTDAICESIKAAEVQIGSCQTSTVNIETLNLTWEHVRFPASQAYCDLSRGGIAESD
jgi:beta-galactosidase